MTRRFKIPREANRVSKADLLFFLLRTEVT